MTSSRKPANESALILKPIDHSSPCKTLNSSKISDNQLKSIQENPIDSIRKLKLSNPHKIMLGHLSFNSLWNKFESIADVNRETFDFFLSETKIEENFPDKQFCIDNFRIFRKDRNRYGRGIMLYVNANLFCKRLTTETDNLIETAFLEVNVQGSKWLFVGCYKPPSQNEEFFISKLHKTIMHFQQNMTIFD